MKSYVEHMSGIPHLQPFWAAGYSFSKSHAVRRVPYDPHTAFLFHGEEFSRGARLWTSGYDLRALRSSAFLHRPIRSTSRYDFYSPSENLVFHHYNRKVRRPDTEGGERWNKGYKILQRSGRRVHVVLKMDLDGANANTEYDAAEMKKCVVCHVFVVCCTTSERCLYARCAVNAV